jgi:hypothetical protein
MTANIPASLVNVLVVAFVLVIFLGIALGAYAARNMKRMEAEAAPATPDTPDVSSDSPETPVSADEQTD